jgi:tetratricopeptide (TPR) repeat protein
MTRLLLTAALALGLAPLSAARQAATDWNSLTQRLETATLADDSATLKAVRADLLRMLAAGPPADRVTLVHYAIAYAGWRLATNPSLGEREQEGLLDEAEGHLKEALKMDSKFAEGHALLSGVYGLKIAHSSIRGMTLGPRSSAAVDEAMKLEPDNPRVLLSKGIGRFNTPWMFGGSAKEAEELLKKAVDRFSREPTEKPWPNWGRFDVHAWLGQVVAKRGDKAGARAEYTKALEVAPQSGWIRYVLMPALENK